MKSFRDLKTNIVEASTSSVTSGKVGPVADAGFDSIRGLGINSGDSPSPNLTNAPKDIRPDITAYIEAGKKTGVVEEDPETGSLKFRGVDGKLHNTPYAADEASKIVMKDALPPLLDSSAKSMFVDTIISLQRNGNFLINHKEGVAYFNGERIGTYDKNSIQDFIKNLPIDITKSVVNKLTKVYTTRQNTEEKIKFSRKLSKSKNFSPELKNALRKTFSSIRTKNGILLKDLSSALNNLSKKEKEDFYPLYTKAVNEIGTIKDGSKYNETAMFHVAKELLRNDDVFDTIEKNGSRAAKRAVKILTSVGSNMLQRIVFAALDDPPPGGGNGDLPFPPNWGEYDPSNTPNPHGGNDGGGPTEIPPIDFPEWVPPWMRELLENWSELPPWGELQQWLLDNGYQDLTNIFENLHTLWQEFTRGVTIDWDQWHVDFHPWFLNPDWSIWDTFTWEGFGQGPNPIGIQTPIDPLGIRGPISEKELKKIKAIVLWVQFLRMLQGRALNYKVLLFLQRNLNLHYLPDPRSRLANPWTQRIRQLVRPPAAPPPPRLGNPIKGVKAGSGLVPRGWGGLFGYALPILTITQDAGAPSPGYVGEGGMYCDNGYCVPPGHPNHPGIPDGWIEYPPGSNQWYSPEYVEDLERHLEDRRRRAREKYGTDPSRFMPRK